MSLVTTDVIEEIQEFQELLATAKSERDRLLGRKETLLQALKDDFGIKTMLQAKQKLQEFQDIASELKEDIEKTLIQIRKYDLGN